jgi:hypothetical protein
MALQLLKNHGGLSRPAFFYAWLRNNKFLQGTVVSPTPKPRYVRGPRIFCECLIPWPTPALGRRRVPLHPALLSHPRAQCPEATSSNPQHQISPKYVHQFQMYMPTIWMDDLHCMGSRRAFCAQHT